MTYKLEQIEGIGPHFAARLTAAGVRNTDELLERCASDQGMRELASNSATSVMQLTAWKHQADLMRVSGIGSEFGQLLEASGVESVEQLSKREPENVVNLLHRVNSARKLTRAVPSLKTVSKWITRAKEMVPGWRERDRAPVREGASSFTNDMRREAPVESRGGAPQADATRDTTRDVTSGDRSGNTTRETVGTGTTGVSTFGNRPW